MKVICDSCHAKYSLSDDKIVKGKTFKIKCKKCGNTILVKPEESNPEEEATRVVDYNAVAGGSSSASTTDADARIWHVAIGDKTEGPLTAPEVIDQIVSGKLGPDSLAWNEGLPTWEKISTIQEFASHFSAQSAAPSEPIKSAKRDSRVNMEAVKVETPQEPAPEPASKGNFFGAEEEESVPSTSLKGQRHENSVLFSLDNLQNLAASQPKKSSPRPGYITPSSAGSGLVDIQEMAAAMKGSQPGRPESAVPFDLPAAPVVATPISIAPVLIPTQMESEKPKWILPAIIGAGVAIVVVGIFLVWNLTAKKSAPAASGNNKPSADTVVMANNMSADMPADTMGPGDMPADMPADAMEPDMPADMPADAMEPDMPADMPADAMEPDMPADMTSSSGMEGPKGPGKGTTISVSPQSGMTISMEPVAPMDMPVNNDMPADGGCTKVWCMLKNNQPDCCAPFRGGSSSSGDGGSDACANNPNETLSPGDVKDAMSSVRGVVSGCFSKFGVSGKVTIRVSVSCQGSVQSASAIGEHAGTPLGGCIEKVVRNVKFPKFKKPASKSFQYPFVG